MATDYAWRLLERDYVTDRTVEVQRLESNDQRPVSTKNSLKLAMTQQAELITRTQGRIGHIELHRPQALNALSFEMVCRMDKTLQQWEQDDSIDAVFVSGNGERAFCAGGDVKSVYLAGKAGELGRDGTLTADFFRHEYRLNFRIANYPKPYVSYLDGITMGGGVGISVLGSHRIATENTLFAMPETGIGFFPDVGGSYFLSRLGPAGVLLALTGRSINHEVTLNLGLATHFVPRDDGKRLCADIANEGVECALGKLRRSSSTSRDVTELQDLASSCFVGNSLTEIVDRLERVAANPTSSLSESASAALTELRTRSPTSLAVTFEQLRRGHDMSLRDCLIMEYRISQACMHGHDFYEGIRALLVDKDRTPKWSPVSIEEVDESLVKRHFESLGQRDLRLDDPASRT